MDDSSAVAGVVRASALTVEALPVIGAAEGLAGWPAVRAVPAADGRWVELRAELQSGLSLSESFTLPLGDRVVEEVEGEPVSLPPPVTNRGVEKPETPPQSLQGCGAHWLNVTVWAPVLEVLDRLILALPGSVFDDEVGDWFEECSYGTQHFARRWIAANGIAVMAEPRAGGGFVCVKVPGSALEGLGGGWVQRFLGMLEEVGVRWRASRFDFAWDGVPFTVKQFWSAVEGRQVKSRVKYELPARRDPRTGEEVERAPIGRFIQDTGGHSTAYLGRRSSSWLFRCYDARGPVRFEVEFHGELADRVVRSLLTHPVSRWSEWCMGAVVHCADLVDRPEGARASRCSRLVWWHQFVGSAQCFEFIKAAAVRVHQAAVQTVEGCKAVVRRAARLIASLPGELRPLVDWLVDEAAKSVPPADRLRAEQWRRAAERKREAFRLGTVLEAVLCGPCGAS